MNHPKHADSSITTVHVIFNAHLDPIWLWPWQAGLDEALATCRSACDRLDAHPDIFFTRGEAWVYNMVERTDPQLFQRIQGHVQAGRWEIVGGWWIQPDCNLPSGFALRHQIALGKEYFTDRFGLFPKTAYNVDTFGHSATLPAMMYEAGQRQYVMMRPDDREKPLPSRLFRWQGYDGGPRITTFRISDCYCTGHGAGEAHVRASLQGIPDGVGHTMCFFGIGDHGGGPSERQIAWIRDHHDAFDGCRLEFSSVSRFFKAIANDIPSLPLVTGELQPHAVGCYSVHQSIKLGVRRAEHRLAQAEIVATIDPHPETSTAADLKEAWRQVCFNHFHDTLGGSAIPSAYPPVDNQLGHAQAVADRIIQMGLRRHLTLLPGDPKQRIVLLNASDAPYAGYVEIEPWLEWQTWKPNWRIIDEKGRSVPYQRMAPEGYIFFLNRFLLRVSASPGQVRVLRIDSTSRKPTESAPAVKATRRRLANDRKVSLNLAGRGSMQFSTAKLPLPELAAIEDPSDTWAHGLDAFGGRVAARAKWDEPTLLDSGPLMASVIRTGTIARSPLKAEYRVYAGEGFVELILSVHWVEAHRVLKMILRPGKPILRSFEGNPGGEVQRQPQGLERPVRDRTLLHLSGGQRLGIVCPEVYGLDVSQGTVRLTLVRSPLLACYNMDPTKTPTDFHRAVVSDQGVHTFRFRFFCGRSVTGALLDQQALMLQRPLEMADLTRGMSPLRDSERTDV